MRSRMDLVNLSAFAEVAEKLSFVEASKVLNISPSALSRRIQKLEESLGAVLLSRTTREVGLTVAGRHLLARSHAILAEVDEMTLAFRGQAAARSQSVTIACLPSATRCFLLPVLTRFRKLHPEVNVHILDGTTNEVLEAVQRQEADFGINYMGGSEVGLEFVDLIEDVFVLAVGAYHKFAGQSAVSWEETMSERNISVRKGSGIRMLIDAGLARAAKQVKWSYEVRHVDTALCLVEAGLGVAVVPQTVLFAAGKRNITAVEMADPRISRSLGLIRLGNKHLRPIAHELWRLTTEELAGAYEKFAFMRGVNAGRAQAARG